MGSQIAQRTQIYFQSPAEIKEIKEISLKVTQISQISQIFTDKFFLEHEICRIPTSARSNYHEQSSHRNDCHLTELS